MRLRARSNNTRTATNAGNLNVSKPSGTANNDWLIAIATSNSNNNGTIAIPAGFTSLVNVSNFRVAGYKLASSEGGSYDFACGNPDGAGAWNASILSYKDGDPSVPPTVGSISTETSFQHRAQGQELFPGIGVIMFVSLQGTDLETTECLIQDVPTGVDGVQDTELYPFFYTRENFNVVNSSGGTGQCSLYVADTSICKPAGTQSKAATLIDDNTNDPISRNHTTFFIFLYQALVTRDPAPTPVEVLLELDVLDRSVEIVSQPSAISNAAWTKTGITIDNDQTMPNPFGQALASTIDETNANSEHKISIDLTLADNTRYVTGVWLKDDQRDWVRFRILNKAGTAIWQWFNIDTMVLGTASGIIESLQFNAFLNGWSFVGFAFNSASGGSTPALSVALATADPAAETSTYTGTTGSGIYIYWPGMYAVQTQRYSQRGLIYPDNTFYPARVLSQIMVAQLGMDAITLGGRAALTVSGIDLYNGDDALNEMTTKNLALGRPAVIKTMSAPTQSASDAGGGALSGAKTVFSGVVGGFQERTPDSAYDLRSSSTKIVRTGRPGGSSRGRR